MAKKETVVVGMSGGVDSSLTAALLLQQGYEVVGITMRLWEDTTAVHENHLGCCALDAVNDAKKVCDILGIAHYVLNFREPFREKVVQYFIDEYIAGNTPNPCIACNRYMKFDLLLKKAMEIGADYVATGHYARVEYDNNLNRYLLKKGIDTQKDQSYVLYHLNQVTLAHFLFPLGSYTKLQTRHIAEKLKLPVAHKKESQEICFIPDDDYKSFITRMAPESLQKGFFVDTKGKILGEHHGLGLYTVGQRKGLGIAFGKPMYVVKLDKEKNQVVLGSNEEVFARELIAADVNLIMFDKLSEKMLVNARIRYNAKESPAYIEPLSDGKIKVVFETPQRAVTPGQSVVFYQNDIVVGGGVIREVSI